MQYEKLTDLPEAVQEHLPEHAQEIYRAAFNNAWVEYKDPADRLDHNTREESAHRVAWGAVERSYAKGSDGSWHKK